MTYVPNYINNFFTPPDNMTLPIGQLAACQTRDRARDDAVSLGRIRQVPEARHSCEYGLIREGAA